MDVTNMANGFSEEDEPEKPDPKRPGRGTGDPVEHIDTTTLDGLGNKKPNLEHFEEVLPGVVERKPAYKRIKVTPAKAPNPGSNLPYEQRN